MNECLNSCYLGAGGIITGGMSPKGMALSRKKFQVGLGEGGEEKELEGTQTILRNESWSLVRTDLKNFLMS